VKNGYGNNTLSLDFQQFQQIYHVEEFYKMLEEKPKIALLCMDAAVHKVCLKCMSIVGQGFIFFK